jgi:AraC-like DNA-binding protein
MKYLTYPPSPALAGYVRYFWVLEGNAHENAPFLHRTLASGYPELMFHYQGKFMENASNGPIEASFVSGIHAQTNKYRQFSIAEDFGILGVHLFPYALPALLNRPSSAISNLLPDLSDLLGREGRELEEKIMLAKDTVQRIALVSNFMEKRLSRSEKPEIVAAVRHIIQANGQVNIGQLASSCSWSRRQFERNFLASAGFPPRHFARIIRFNALISQYQKSENSLTEMAYDFGYFDQAHFIHDFNAFSGQSPGAFFSNRNAGFF